jgi:histidinol phosphatase-like enzyme
MKDLQAASAYGCKPLLVKTGKGADTLASLQSGAATLDYPQEVPVYQDLADAAKAILST